MVSCGIIQYYSVEYIKIQYVTVQFLYGIASHNKNYRGRKIHCEILRAVLAVKL